MPPKPIGNPKGQASHTTVNQKRGSTECSNSASLPRYNFRVRPINSQPPVKKPRRRKQPFPLLKLPSELVLLVAEQIDDVKDLSSLTLANRCLANLLEDLLQRFAMMEDQPPQYSSKLLWAVTLGRTPLVKRLLRNRNNADYVNTGNSVKRTALSIAAGFGDEEVVRLLLENGASVLTRCQRLGRTPIHYAILSSPDPVKIIQLLLEHGADPSIKDHYGYQPIFYPLIWLEVKHTPDVFTAMVKVMLDKGVNDINEECQGRNLLNRAASVGNEQMVRLLLDYGADITVVDSGGKTALERDKIWASGGHSGVTRALLERWPKEVPLPELPKYQPQTKPLQRWMQGRI